VSAVARDAGRKQQCEVTSIDDQRRADDITVTRVAPRTTACLDLNDDAVFVVKGIDLVRHGRLAILAKQDGPPDLAVCGFAGLEREAELNQSPSA